MLALTSVALAEDAAFPDSKVFQALGKSDVAGSLACLLRMNSMATLMRTEPADLTPFRCPQICAGVTHREYIYIKKNPRAQPAHSEVE